MKSLLLTLAVLLMSNLSHAGTIKFNSEKVQCLFSAYLAKSEALERQKGIYLKTCRDEGIAETDRSTGCAAFLWVASQVRNLEERWDTARTFNDYAISVPELVEQCEN